jgi:PhzF family phenazine biosynthesis protein
MSAETAAAATTRPQPSHVRQQPGAPIRIALVGYGLGGAAFHAPFIATTPGLELAAIVTGDGDRQRQASHDHPGVRIVADVTRLWEPGAGIDAVVISTPNRTHVPLALAAIDAGLHAVVDKPIAPSAAEARQLADAASRRGVLVVPYQNRRWDGDFLTIRRILADGAIGEPLRFESRFDRWRPATKGGWRELGAPDEAGGLLFDLGSHLIDQALTLFGPAREVYGELDRRRAGVQSDDDTFVALTHASGVRSHLWMSALAAQPSPRFRLLGARGAYTKWGLDVQEDALRAGARPGGPEWGVEPEDRWGTLGAGDDTRPVATERGNYGAFYAAVARAIRDDAPPPVAIADAIATLDVIEAARVSAEQRTVIRLPRVATRAVTVYQVDAFTKQAFTGNPAGVVLDATGLTDTQMQRIAFELGNSETAFLFPPDGDGHDVRIRYFTPKTEVPLCGHATIAAHYTRAVVHALDPGTVVQRGLAGDLPVVLTRENGDYQVTLTLTRPTFEPPLTEPDVARLRSALGVEPAALMPNAPVQIVAAGHGKVLVGLRRRETLMRLAPDMAALAALSRDIRCNGYHVFTFDTGDPTVLTSCRMFAPAIGVDEDPVTGNGNGPLGAYLVKHGLVPHDGRRLTFRSAQGASVGRPGFVHVAVDIDHGEPVRVQIGRDAVIVFKAELYV